MTRSWWGPPYEDSNATGVSNSAQAGHSNNVSDASGAAYVFALSGVVNPEPVPPSPVLPPEVAGLVTQPVATLPPSVTVPSSTVSPTNGPSTTVPSVAFVPATGSVLTVSGDGRVVVATVVMGVVGESTSVTIRNANGTTLVLEHDTISTDTGGGMLRGGSVTVTGEGFQANTTLDVWLNSSPRFLGSTVTGGDGTFVFEVTIPSDVELGSHMLRFEGVGHEGVEQSTMLGVAVVDVLAQRLPATGTSPLIGWALLVTAVGVVVLVRGGRRRTEWV